MNRRTLTAGSLLVSAVGLVLLVIGLFVDAPRAWFAYLVAWAFGTTICVGALLFLMAGHAAKASWTIVTRRITESIVGALPLYLVLFLPLCFGLAHVYPWATAAGAAGSPALARAIEHKRAYLNPPFFIVRSILYFSVFQVVGGLLRTWSKANDERPTIGVVHRMRGLSAGALPLVGIALTWASFDWIMSLEPDWSSTIFGLYNFAGAFVGAIALVAIMARRRPSATPDHAQAIGRLLFAMTAFWAYMAFSQLLIYWISDIPDEVGYYRLRTTGSWKAVTYALVFGNFLIPFFLLLNRHWKRRFEYLARVAAWLFLMHFVDVYWMVMPVHDRLGLRPSWLDLAAALFVGGLSCASIVRRYSTAAPIPLHAPELADGLGYEASV